MMFGDERWCRWQNVSQLATIFIIFDGAGQRWPALASLIYHSARTPGPSQPQYQNIWTISRAGKEPSRNLKFHNHIELQKLGRQHKSHKVQAGRLVSSNGHFHPREGSSSFAKLISSSNHQPPPPTHVPSWAGDQLLHSSPGSCHRAQEPHREYYNVHIHECRHLISIIFLIPR